MYCLHDVRMHDVGMWHGRYGTEIKTVYVERKTHLDSWTGNVSVKERFSLEEALVVPFCQGSYTVNEFADDMKRKGKKDADIEVRLAKRRHVRLSFVSSVRQLEDMHV